MSNALAISAVTRTVMGLLDKALREQPGQPGFPAIACKISTAPPDENVRKKDGNLLGLFLYHVAPNAAWRNDPIAGRGKPNEPVPPPLALNLSYLITVFFVNTPNDEYQVLGRVMSALHDHSILTTADFTEFVDEDLLHNSGLLEQPERVKLTPQPLSIEHLSKLWSGFQTHYRLSVGYEASVVLIESTRPSKTPLPVLTRGRRSVPEGFEAEALSGIPSLTAPQFPYPNPPGLPTEGPRPKRSLSGGHVSDLLWIDGTNLGGNAVTLAFRHTTFSEPRIVPVPPAQRTATRIAFRFTGDEPWPAGFYTVAATVWPDGLLPDNAPPWQPSPRHWTTNELTFSLVPDISLESSNAAVLKVDVFPEVQPNQRVSLLLSAVEIPAGSIVAAVDQFQFRLSDAPLPPPDDNVKVILYPRPLAKMDRAAVRLRVDGVDSFLFDPESDVPQIKDTYRRDIPERKPDL